EEQKNRRTEEQKNRRTEEQKNRRTEEQKNRRTEEQKNRRALQLPWQTASLNISLAFREHQMRKGHSIKRPFLMWSV
ncbi:hypothetical protein, partial [Aeromonas hydrophila]|uniref:hypothetical protein n=1 Tax=Aeromonas hydrophila TaxID=644 RepID=UPI00301B2AC0